MLTVSKYLKTLSDGDKSKRKIYEQSPRDREHYHEMRPRLASLPASYIWERVSKPPSELSLHNLFVERFVRGVTSLRAKRLKTLSPLLNTKQQINQNSLEI